MNFDTRPEDERFLDLMALKLAGTLSPEQEQELVPLLAARPAETIELWEKLAADVALTTATERYESLPAHLHKKILAGFAGQRPSEIVRVEQVVRPAGLAVSAREWTGWLAAAACAVIALVFWTRRPEGVPDPRSVLSPQAIADAREKLLAQVKQPGTKVVYKEWTATADPAAVGASGDVVWDNEHQTGYMLFRGLAKNDSQRNQYQLWIFDHAQDERYPIDGGVFDIDSASGDVIVPIRAKLSVREPTLFAVTVEKPGGVVVSSRERLPLLAKLK